MIQIAGYTIEEKVEIAWRYLLPKLFEEHGITDKDLQFTDEMLGLISSGYSREAGLRGFSRNIAAIMRKRARKKADGEEGAWVADLAMVEEVLGSPRYAKDEAETEPEIGTATGMAWTSTGGDLLVIEALKMPGTGKLTITGQLGDVMRESVHAALSYVRSRATQLAIPDTMFKDFDIHIHLPAGAIPKDGPSAGITVTLAIASALAERPVRRDVAMTGEVTLRGKVLEVGGVKEKLMAAYRAGLREAILPKSNEKDLREIPDEVRENMTFTFASNMDEVFRLALLAARVEGPRRQRAQAGRREQARHAAREDRADRDARAERAAAPSRVRGDRRDASAAPAAAGRSHQTRAARAHEAARDGIARALHRGVLRGGVARARVPVARSGEGRRRRGDGGRPGRLVRRHRALQASAGAADPAHGDHRRAEGPDRTLAREFRAAALPEPRRARGEAREREGRGASRGVAERARERARGRAPRRDRGRRRRARAAR